MAVEARLAVTCYPLVIAADITYLRPTGEPSAGFLAEPLCLVLEDELEAIPAEIREGLPRLFSNGQHYLGYDRFGRLTRYIRRDGAFWLCVDTPDVFPALHLVFRDERARLVFRHYLDQVLAGKMEHPTVSMMLDSLVVPPEEREWRLFPDDK